MVEFKCEGLTQSFLSLGANGKNCEFFFPSGLNLTSPSFLGVSDPVSAHIGVLLCFFFFSILHLRWVKQVK